MIAATPDRFRGTTQRWRFDSGPLSGVTRDHTFNEDWSLNWREPGGSQQGAAGRARAFSVQPVRSQLFLLSFAIAPGETVTAAVDFASERFVGFQSGSEYRHAIGGSVHML